MDLASAEVQPEDKQQEINVSEIEPFWQDVSTKYHGFLPDATDSLMDVVKGDSKATFSDWGGGLLKFFAAELIANGRLLGMLILLTVFSAVLNTLQTSFEQSNVSKVASAIVVMVLVLFAISSFHTVAGYIIAAIGTISDFLMAIIPVLIAMTATSGGVLSASFLHPIMLFFINTSVLLVQYVVIRVLFFSTILGIVNELSDQIKVSSIATLMRTVGIWLLGIVMTVFMAVLSIQGIASAVADGVGMRTAKYVSSNFIPVVGKMLTDATDTVANASVLLKNSIGIFGLIVLFVIIVFPAIKIFVIALLYRIAAAVLQPIGDRVVVKSLEVIGKNLIYLFAAYVLVGFMFFLAVTIIIATGNITMMVR